jgi:hypothetical protein
VEGKERRQRRDKAEREKKEEWFSPRTYAQFRKTAGTFLQSKISHQSKTLMKKCPKRKLESFSNSTILL